MSYDLGNFRGIKTPAEASKAILGKNPYGNIYGNKSKKRKTLTAGQRLYIWEHPKLYGRTCNICHERITKQSELELDHTKAHSKGGKRLALAHKHCNRMKGSGSLRKIQKSLGIKTKRKRRTTKKKPVRRKPTNPFSSL